MLRLLSLPYLLMIASIVGALAPSPIAAVQRSRGDAGVPGEVIVRLVASADPHSFARSAGLRLGRSGANQIPGRPIYRFEVIDETTPGAKAKALAGNQQVIYAEPNYLGQVPEAQKRSSWVVGGDAGVYAAQWVAERIGLDRAHTVSRGAGVTVAILDTGVELGHPALAGRLADGYDFVDSDDAPEEVGNSSVSDAFGHGTHVAGLVALAAPEASIMPLRTLDDQGLGDLWTQVLALRYAADHRADVINLSFSFGEHSALFDDVIAEVTCTTTGYTDCRAQNRPGVVVIAAAGNSGSNTREWPGASTLPGIVAVAASTEHDGLAAFSNYGAWVPLAAPGENVLSSVPHGIYASWSGTSMAAPLVSGVSALVRSTDPHLGPADVIKRIIGTADVIDAPVRHRLDAAQAIGAP